MAADHPSGAPPPVPHPSAPQHETHLAAHGIELADVQSVREQKTDPFFAKRVQVYPKRVWGTFRRLKWTALFTLLGVYYLLPWLRWDRGPNAPDQAVLVDMDHERAYFFFIEIWAQEVYYLTGVLILAAIGLFLVTSLFGRVWCGYACPQTVWTDLFMWVERRIEGDRSARIRRDKQPWSVAKFARKAAKHAVWLLIALLTGGAWILYFEDAPTLAAKFFTGDASSSLYFFVGLFTVTTYSFAGLMREQVCTFMCPWPRFQSAMLDEDTMVVTYEDWRGEPRGVHRKGSDAVVGDCVDCKQCVAVCPTGIDIRDGIQLECIGCGLCIDACNDVMAKVGSPPNLISYDTERRVAERSRGGELRYRLFRPRTLLYVLLMAVVGGIMLFSLLTRSSQGINVLHDRTKFVRLSDGSIRNGYEIKILNKARRARKFVLTVHGIDKARLSSAGAAGGPAARLVLTAKPDDVTAYQVFVQAPAAALKAADTKVTFRLVEQATGEATERQINFTGPAPAPQDGRK